jgi:hypothetical protein
VTTELILILGLYAFILLGTFLGDRGPIATFKQSAPRLAAKIEKDISIGKNFNDAARGGPSVTWQDPDPKQGGQ